MSKPSFLALFSLLLMLVSGKAFACARGDPAAIPLQARTGEYRFEEEKARIQIPKGSVFLDAQDARRFAQKNLGWDKCSVSELVGIIFPEAEWKKFGAEGHLQFWNIMVYYQPGLVEIEDAISADYDSMVDQVRQSYVEFNKTRVAQSLDPINVAGWGVPPGIHGQNLVTWGLNLLEGNRPNFQSIDVKAAKLGRKGHFHFTMSAPVLQLQDYHKILLAAGNATNFDKGFDLDSRALGSGETMVMTVGDLIAKDLQAKRPTPLTWTNYLKATFLSGFHHFAFYLVEILAFLTVGGVLMMLRWLSLRAQRHAAAYGEEDEIGEVHSASAPSALGTIHYRRAGNYPRAGKRAQAATPARSEPQPILLNGVPLARTP